jgi:tRNA(fMet)-specific endonuclease VapC
MSPSMRYLLDTNACIHAMRGDADVVSRIVAHSPADLTVSAITCFELFAGIEKCANPAQERAKVERLLETVGQLAFDNAAASYAARIRADLESRGAMIGPYDILLAGHALSLGMILVTANTREFARVIGLTVENWKSAI